MYNVPSEVICGRDFTARRQPKDFTARYWLPIDLSGGNERGSDENRIIGWFTKRRAIHKLLHANTHITRDFENRPFKQTTGRQS